MYVGSPVYPPIGTKTTVKYHFCVPIMKDAEKVFVLVSRDALSRDGPDNEIHAPQGRVLLEEEMFNPV